MRWIFYDTETTGLVPEKDRIIEIAAFDPARNKEFVSLINPGCPIPKEAMAIHKITDEMVADAPPFQEVAEAFCQFCEGEVVLVAHNNDAFDKHFLRWEFSRLDKPLPNWRFVDSLKWARRYRPDLPRHQLQFLRELFGIPANTAHRALDDVLVLHNVFTQMIDDLPVETVIALLDKPAALQTMPFGKYQGTPLDRVPKDYVQWLVKNGALDKPENQELKAAFEQLKVL